METCYRHPSRETGVACSNCGRPICPDCMTSTPVGMRCPECARQRTKVKTMESIQTPLLTFVLIGVNVAIWLGFALTGDSGDDMYADLALSRGGLADGDYWQLLTSGFLHARLGESYGFLHIFSNMFSLFILGGMLEPATGRLRLGLIYLVSLVAGGAGALLVEPSAAVVGASGAVFGLMGAVVVIMRSRGIDPMESGLLLWIGINFVLTFTIPGISIGGHIGGMVGGAAAAAILFELPGRVGFKRPLPELLTAGLGVAAVAVAIGVSP